MLPYAFIFKGFSQEALDNFVHIIEKKLEGFEFNTFSLGCSFLNNLSETAITELRKNFQAPLIKTIEKKLKVKADFTKPDIEIIIDFNSGKISFYIRPIFLYGIYKKFSRELPQTIYYCFKCKGKGKGCSFCNETGRLAKESIQEILGKYFMKAFGARDNKFHGAGREDIDVRMLGNGREFVIELLEPKKRSLPEKELKKLAAEINKKEKTKLEISDLKIVGKETVAKIKEKKNDKLYEAVVECDSVIDEKELQKLVKDYFVEQRTPERVKKRRSDLTRVRKAQLTRVKKISAKKFSFQIKASSGLYVKEFISGDKGRTSPSISSELKKNCICKELDVIKIFR